MITQKKEPKSNKRPKVGVVVGSGGIKAISSIALFEFLEKESIEVDLLVSCSGGGIFTSWWAMNGSAAEIRENVTDLWTRDLFAKVDYRTLLSIAGLPFGRFDKSNGLIKPDNVHSTYANLYCETMVEDLPIKSILLAVNLQNGKPVLLTSGLVREAVYASGALFPILPPIYMNDQWLIDGAFNSPLPTLVAVNEGMDIIISMSNEEVTNHDSKGFVQYFMRCIGYMQSSLQRNQAALAIDLHHNEIIPINVVFDRIIGLRSTRRIPQIIKAGEDAVEAKKNEILTAIARFDKQ
jgi:NTE family protein